MTEDTNDRAVPGDNLPPEPIAPVFPTAEELIAYWAAKFAETIAKALDVRVGMKKVPEIDATSAPAATSFVVQAKAVEKLLEAARAEHKGEIDKLAKAAQAFFKDMQLPLETDFKALEQRVGVYDKKVRADEEARQKALRDAEALAAREAELEQERLQMAADLAAELAATPEEREAAAAAIVQAEDAKKVVTLHQKEAAKPVVTCGVRGSIGGVGVASGHWAFELVDLTKVPAEYLQLNTVLINQTIRGEAGLHDIPGLRVYRAENFSVRA